MILLQNFGIQIIIIIVIKKENHNLFIYNSDVSHSMLCLLSSTTTKIRQTQILDICLAEHDV